MKKPTKEERQHQCIRKRRYRSQGDALDAAAITGRERDKVAYRCVHCGHWHLATRVR